MKTYSRHDFTRVERAARAKVAISAAFESNEQAFLDFVLSHYVRVGVQELDQEKLPDIWLAKGTPLCAAARPITPSRRLIQLEQSRGLSG